MTGSKVARFPFKVFATTMLVAAGVFVAAGLEMHDFGRAWDVMTGSASPFGTHQGIGIAISAIGYLAIPAVIGLFVADVVTRHALRHLITRDEAERTIGELVSDGIKAVIPPATGQTK